MISRPTSKPVLGSVGTADDTNVGLDVVVAVDVAFAGVEVVLV
jgi:hypothetical protein